MLSSRYFELHSSAVEAVRILIREAAGYPDPKAILGLLERMVSSRSPRAMT